MKLALIALAAVSCLAEKASKNPLGEVISLLDSLTAKIVAEGKAELKAYRAYVEWCDDFSKNKNFEIQTATAQKEKLTAEISQLSADIESSTAKIDDLAGSIGSDEKDLHDATLIRTKEAADFAANEAELSDVIDTLSRAIAILEREMAKNPAAFAQVDVSSLDGVLKSIGVVMDAAAFPTADKQKLLALVQSQQADASDDDAPGAPAAAVYKTHSTNILDVLEDLKEKAEEQLSALRKAEENTKHNYNMLKQSLEMQVADDTKHKNAEMNALAASQESRATASADLQATAKDLADGKATLKSGNAGCMQVAADHDATIAGRTEELKVIAEAREILVSSTSGAVEQTYSMLQTSSSMQTHADMAGAEVVNIVKRLAKEYDSAALAQLASRIAAVMQYGAGAGEDPFVKVRGLIKALIVKLQAEAGAEATEKAYCDEQMSKTEARQTELEDDVARLTSRIDQATARSKSLKAQVKQLQADLAELAKLQAEMDTTRQEENAAYVEAKADLEEGLGGVRQALGVLRDYYGSGASAASMMQLMQPATPELHEKAQGAGNSIIGILEVVESDFAKNLAQEETEEADAAAEYEKTTQANKVTRTMKEQDVKYKTQEFVGLDKNIAEMSADRKSTQAELDAVNDYYDKIKDRCIAKAETYETRKAKREAEIKGLKEALNILENETAFTQRRKKGMHSHFLGL